MFSSNMTASFPLLLLVLLPYLIAARLTEIYLGEQEQAQEQEQEPEQEQEQGRYCSGGRNKS